MTLICSYQNKRVGLPDLFLSFLLLLIAYTLLCAFTEPSRAACELRVGWDEWPPYIVQKDGHFQGPEYELLLSTARAAGCKLDMRQIPWARALKMLRSRDLDLLYGAGYSADRASFAKYSIPYREEKFVLVTKAISGNKRKEISLLDWINSGKKLNSPRRLGIFRGDFYGQQIDDILKRNKNNMVTIELSQNEQMIKMLAAGRLDGFILEYAVARIEIQSSSVPMQQFQIKEAQPDPLHYIFSLGIDDEIVKRFNAAIQKQLSVDN